MTHTESASAIVATGLVKRFRAHNRLVTVLDGLDCSIPAGGITAIVGPDAAGKTTLLRLIAGLLRPDAGRLEVFGHDAVREAETIQAGIGYMPQRFGLYEDLSVAENLSLHADLRQILGDERKRRFGELLEFTGLAPFTDRLTGRLSGGMKQKLGLACSLLANPKLLLLDEPSAGVDPLSRRQLWRMVERLTDGGTTVVWSTAYLDEAGRCHEVLLLHEGRLLDRGAPGDFVRRLEGRTFLALGPPAARRKIQALAMEMPAVTDISVQGAGLRLVLQQGAAPPSAASLGCEQIEPVAPRLEDAFVNRLRPVTGVLARHLGTEGPPRALGEPVIEVQNLTKKFGSFIAVDRANFAVRRGEIFGLLGPNGAGKSTIFRMLCGLLPPSAGSARVVGFDLGRSSAAARARIGYMPQKFSLYGDLSVRQNLEFFARTYGLSGAKRRARIDWVLDEFALRWEQDASCNNLPLGYRQVALGARCILQQPPAGIPPALVAGVRPHA